MNVKWYYVVIILIVLNSGLLRHVMRLFRLLSVLPTVVSGLHLPWLTLQGTAPWYARLDVKVPVQLGVMSRCPDALLCESVFNDVLKEVADKVDLSLVYIAKYGLWTVCQRMY